MTGSAVDISVQYAVDRSAAPPEDFIVSCARSALPQVSGELAIRIVDLSESAELNERYRGKSGPTNVLAFPAGDSLLPAGEPEPLGDIVICAAVVAREAEEQGKSLEAHWAHMVIHGCLHLTGYDHIVGPDARRMERREAELLAMLGIADPYGDES